MDKLHARGVDLRVLSGAGAETGTTAAWFSASLRRCPNSSGELIAERTRVGLVAARAKGHLRGRPRKMDTAMLRMAMRAMTSRGTIAQDLVQRLGITTTDPVHVH